MANLGEQLSVIDKGWQILRNGGALLRQWLCRDYQQREQARRAQIVAWRAALDRDDFQHQRFAHSNEYATLRDHLPEDLRDEIDRWRNPMMVVAVPPGGRDSRQARLLQEIARIERAWGLL
jgi:hypothetical protein